jgi:hypothetical protein
MYGRDALHVCLFSGIGGGSPIVVSDVLWVPAHLLSSRRLSHKM